MIFIGLPKMNFKRGETKKIVVAVPPPDTFILDTETEWIQFPSISLQSVKFQIKSVKGKAKRAGRIVFDHESPLELELTALADCELIAAIVAEKMLQCGLP
jgi:hypothetical protein